MANVISITINGNDASGAAMNKALVGTTKLGAQTKQLNKVFSEAGQIANAFGNQAIGGIANQAGNLIGVIDGLRAAFGRINKAQLAIMAAVATAAAGIHFYTKWKDAAKAAADATERAVDLNSQLAIKGAKQRAKEIELQMESARSLEDLITLHKTLDGIQTKSKQLEDLETRTKLMREYLDLLKAGANDDDLKSLKETIDSLYPDQQSADAAIGIHRTRLSMMKELDEAYARGNVELFLDMVAKQNDALGADLEGKKQFLEVYRDFWMESHRTMFSYVAEGAKVIASNLSGAIVDVIMRTKSAAEAFKEVGLAIAKMFLTFIIQRGIAFLAEKVMSAIGLGLMKAQSVATAAFGAAAAAAWAPAATAALIATGGLAVANAALLAPAMAANQAAAIGMSLVGGVAHGGMDYIPRESSYLLDEGERVLSPRQNEDLTRFMQGGRGMVIQIDGRKIGEAIEGLIRDGRLRIA